MAILAGGQIGKYMIVYQAARFDWQLQRDRKI